MNIIYNDSELKFRDLTAQKRFKNKHSYGYQ